MDGEERGCREAQSFIKALVSGYREKLRIPPIFARSISEEQEKRDLAWIRIGMGATWEVRLERDPCNSDLCFTGEGWRDFVETHGLQFGYFLRFCHEGDMRFSVLVLDHSSCNRNYVPVAAGRDGSCYVPVASDTNDEDKTAEELMEHGLTEEEQHPARAPNRSRCFEATINYSNIKNSYLHIPTEFLDQHNLWGIQQAELTSSRGKWPVCIDQKCIQGSKTARFSSGWKVFRVKNELMIGNTCVFELIHAKKDVVGLHMTKKRKRDSDSKEAITSSRENKTLVIGVEDSRPSFRDINVGILNPATMEAMPEPCKTMNEREARHIINDSKSWDLAMEKMIKDDHAENKQQQDRIVSRSQHFQVTVKYPNVFEGTYLHIPSWFMEQHNLWGILEAVITSSKGQWLIGIQHDLLWGKKRARFSGGWKLFQIENELRIGDKCVFVLIHEKRNMAVFHMTKKTNCDSDSQETVSASGKIQRLTIDVEDNNPSFCDFDIRLLSSATKETMTEYGKTYEENEDHHITMSESRDKRMKVVMNHDHAANEQKGKTIFRRPHFQVTMKYSQICKGYYMNIPTMFVEQHNLGGVSQAQVMSATGKWCIDVYQYLLCGRKRARFSRGWKVFQLENKLRIGDTCMFVLIGTAKDIVVFHMYKKTTSYSDSNEITTISGKNDMIPMDGDTDHNPFVSCDSVASNARQGRQPMAEEIDCYSEDHISYIIGTENPKFSVRLKQRDICKANLSLPKFHGNEVLRGRRMVILKNRGGRSWLVRLYQKFKCDYFQLGSGWRDFVQDNGLESGDRCSFELDLKEKDVVMLVYSIRNRIRDF